MLAVWCFTVFAAVGERLAFSGKRERARLAEHRQHLFRLFCFCFFQPLHLLIRKIGAGCGFSEVESRQPPH